MRTLTPTLFAFFGLTLVDLPAQYIARVPTTPAATTVQATLVAPIAKLAAFGPIAFELTLTTTGPWEGMVYLQWEQRDARLGTWAPLVDKGPWEPFNMNIAAATTTCTGLQDRVGVLHLLTPGRWRAKALASWRDIGNQQHLASSGWCEIEIQDHAANRAAAHDTKHVLITPWHYVISGSMLIEDVPAALRGQGMLPKGEPMAAMADAIATMRDSGVSTELAVAADLTLLWREMRGLRNMAAGAERTAAAKAPRARLEALAKATPLTATPLGGQHGQVLQVLVALLRLEEPAAAAQRIADVRKTHPMLADQLDQAVVW